MKIKQCICVLAITVLVACCGGSQRKVNKSEAAVNKKSLSLIEDYEKCIKKAGDDPVKAEPCERYRKAAEALK